MRSFFGVLAIFVPSTALRCDLGRAHGISRALHRGPRASPLRLAEGSDDEDLDARIDSSIEAELRKALNRSNLGDAADDFFKAIDKDGSKKIGFDEYLRVRAAERGPRLPPRFSIARRGLGCSRTTCPLFSRTRKTKN